MVLGALLVTSQAFAGWVWIQHDYSIPDPMVDYNGVATVEVKQDEYQWVDGQGVPDESLVAGTPVPAFPGAPGMYLYTYTLTNLSAQTLTSFGFLAPLDSPGILVVRAVDGGWAAGFAAAPVGPAQPYWVAAPGTGFVPFAGGEGFQVIAWGAPRVWAVAGVDVNGRVIASGLTTGPTPEPVSGLLLVASACGLYGFLRRRRE